MDSLDQCALELVARALSFGTCSQTFKLEDSLDQRALEPVARALSSGTCSQTSELGDSSLDLRARRLIARPLGSETRCQTSVLGDSSSELRARGLVVRPSSLGTCYTISCRRIRLARLHVLCLHTVDGRLIFLDPGITCLRHLLPGSGTKWVHFT
jgi:hypothetical protein